MANGVGGAGGGAGAAAAGSGGPGFWSRFGGGARATAGGAWRYGGAALNFTGRNLARVTANAWLYVFMLFLGILDVLLKSWMGYDPVISLFFSIILGVIFFMIVRGNHRDMALLIIVFVFDVLAVKVPLYFFPGTGLKAFFMFMYVFGWVILALLLMFLNAIDNMRLGQPPSWVTELIFLLMVALLLFYFFQPIADIYKKNVDDHAEYFNLVKEQVERFEEVTAARVEDWKVVYYRLECSLSQPMDIEGCVKLKTAEARCKPYKDKGDLEKYEECKRVELGLKPDVQGMIDPTLNEPLTLKWEQSAEFLQKEFYMTTIPTFTAKLKVSNPRKDKLDLELDCYFVDMTANKNISGSIYSTLGEKFSVEEKTKEIDAICSPEEVLEANKRYSVVYQAKLVDFTTKSKIQMLFIGESKTDKLKSMFKSDYPLAGTSRTARDLARLNIEIGKDGYVGDADVIQLAMSVENIGGGKIVSIQKSGIDLMAPGIASGDLTKINPCNLVGDSVLSIDPAVILFQQGQKDILGGVCFLRMSSNLKYPAEFFKVVEFHGDLTYSYLVEGKFLTPVIRGIGGLATT